MHDAFTIMLLFSELFRYFQSIHKRNMNNYNKKDVLYKISINDP